MVTHARPQLFGDEKNEPGRTFPRFFSLSSLSPLVVSDLKNVRASSPPYSTTRANCRRYSRRFRRSSRGSMVMSRTETSLPRTDMNPGNNDCNTADTCLDPSFTSRCALLCGQIGDRRAYYIRSYVLRLSVVPFTSAFSDFFVHG